MITRMPDGSKIRNSTAHVFVRILRQNGGTAGIIVGEGEGLSTEVWRKVADKNRKGRLWIDSFKMKWPEGMSPTPNGKESRTVWDVLIPQVDSAYDEALERSVVKLADWLRAVNLPARIAVYDDGTYYNGGYPSEINNRLRKLIERHLANWDVEIYPYEYTGLTPPWLGGRGG